MENFTSGMPKKYPHLFRCHNEQCRVIISNADQLSYDEVKTLADREIRRLVAQKTRDSANKDHGQSIKWFHSARREKQYKEADIPIFDIKDHMKPSAKSTKKAKDAENERLADLMRQVIAGKLTHEQVLEMAKTHEQQ